MSIRIKILIAFAMVIILSCGTTVYGIKLVGTANELVIALFDGPLIAATTARTAQTDFAEARAAMERKILLGDALPAAAITLVEERTAKVIEGLQLVRERLQTSETTAATEKAINLTQQWLNYGLQIIKPPPGGLTSIPVLSTVQATANEAAAAIDVVSEAAAAMGFDFRSRAEADTSTAKTMMMGLLAGTVCVGFLIALLISHSFTKPIVGAMRISERIAAGDLDVIVTTKRSDELGRLLLSLEAMRIALASDRGATLAYAEREKALGAERSVRHDSMKQQVQEFQFAIANVVDGIESVSADLGATARSLTSVTENADRCSNEANSAAETASGNVRMISAATKQLSSSVGQVSSQLDDTGEVVDAALGAIKNTHAIVTRLDEASKRINKTVALIRAVATQTNLLALNATIEAARAGEAGRGFSVVAAEVKALAGQTAAATEEIINQVDEIQAATQQTLSGIRGIDDVMEKIKLVTQSVNEAAGQQMAATNDIARNIETAAAATQSLVTNFAATHAAVQNTRGSTNEVTDNSGQLATQAQLLRGAIDRFLNDVMAA